MEMIVDWLINNSGVIGAQVVLQSMLSADNALVLPILVKHLPKKQQVLALQLGILGAVVFRIVCVLVAWWLIAFWQFKAAGAAYLIYLAAKHFFFSGGDGETKARAVGPGFWKTILIVELTDVAFSVDSIVAGVALSPDLWVVYAGGVIGLIAMRYVAALVLRMLEKFPHLETAAYLLVAWIGIKLGLECVNQVVTQHHGEGPYTLSKWVLWTVMIVVFAGGLLWPGGKSEVVEHAREIHEFEAEEDKLIPPRHKGGDGRSGHPRA
jgi:YkoY family integral membrane protein